MEIWKWPRVILLYKSSQVFSHGKSTHGVELWIIVVLGREQLRGPGGVPMTPIQGYLSGNAGAKQALLVHPIIKLRTSQTSTRSSHAVVAHQPSMPNMHQSIPMTNSVCRSI